ncbi:MAG: diadenylate cyclase [Desulfobacterota bacterium]|nr:diadenylate cyclase [Thermodesulfobacteriota bacterium]
MIVDPIAHRRLDRELQVLVEEAIQISDKLKIRKLLVICESLSLWKAILPLYATHQFIIVVASKRLAESITVETFFCDFSGVSRNDRLNYVIRSAIETGKIKKGERILCLYSRAGSKLIDTIRIVRIEEMYGPISPRDLKNIGKKVSVDLLFAVVNLAVEIGQEGREGTPVGTIFVVGDADRVLELSKPMIFNPFRGYAEDERNIFDPKVQESIKELALLDGAFVIREDGVVLAAGMYLHGPAEKIAPLKGLGARHAAAAAISQSTNAIAITVSESTGTVRIFSGGRPLKTIRSYRFPAKRVKA